MATNVFFDTNLMFNTCKNYLDHIKTQMWLYHKHAPLPPPQWNRKENQSKTFMLR